MPGKKFWLILFVLTTGISLSYAASFSIITPEWLPANFTHPISKTKVPTFHGAFHDASVDYLPTLTVKLPISQRGDVAAILLEDVWENIVFPGNTFPTEMPAILNAGIGLEKKRPYAVAQIAAMRYYAGTWQRLIRGKVEFRITPDNTILRREGITYPSSSILASGSWYKLAVSNGGIYKLDYNFLKSLGMNPDNLDPSRLKIFGHSDGALPELAGATPYTDAQEIPIQVVTTGSGFKSGDYILAYLPGPEKILFNTSTQIFSHTLHPYSFKKYFFITADGAPGKRINTLPAIPQPEDISIDAYDDYQFLEEEKKNLGLTGRLWVGDEFGIVSTRNYNFPLTGIVTAVPAQINLSAVAFSLSGSTSFQTIANGITLGTLSIAQTPVFSDVVDYGRQNTARYALPNPPSDLGISLNYQRSGGESAGWLNYLAVQSRRSLSYSGPPLLFRSIQNIGPGKITRFNIANAPVNLQVWDVTDPLAIVRMPLSFSGSTASFKSATDTMRLFAAVVDQGTTPEAIGIIPNQNLHAAAQPEMVIVTRPSMLSQANELAALHSSVQGMDVLVVTFEQLCNEFAGGTPDGTAIRNFMKMFYDRAGGDLNLAPKYLLLFGDGTYNNRSLGNFLLPTYQSVNSLGAIQSFVSDDYYGLLDDNEGADVEVTFNRFMDVAVGRIPAENTERANIALDKIKDYLSAASLGNWKNELCFIADDEDNNIHVDDADGIAEMLAGMHPQYNIDKIYLDAYNQQSTAGGSRYPDVNEAIKRKLFAGVRVMNYLGHGGINGLAKERIVTFDDINSWENPGKLPFFVTATCEFTRYDDAGEFTGGERVFFRPNGGAIAMLTTTRLVFSNQNELINRNFMLRLLEQDQLAGSTLGDVILLAKNATNTNIGNRKFALIGDPALPLNYPRHNVVTTQVNGNPPGNDTLKALSKVTVSGEVRTSGGALLNNFNGTANIKLFDKSKNLQTLGNDATSPVRFFKLQRNVIYSGKVPVSDGKFEYTFVVPKDIDFVYGNGKVSYYAENGVDDASGYDPGFVIGGQNENAASDNQGPDVDVFLESEDWAFGGISTPDPILLVNLFDENGINASGNGIGHDIVAILDEDTRSQIILNDFYETELGDFRSGKIRFPLSKIAPGRHSLRVRAWDTYNNSGQGYTEFIVEEKAEIALAHVLNYPNPFTTNTEFSFNHNRPGQILEVKIDIYTVTGRVIKTIRDQVTPEGFRVAGIYWDGKDEFGDNIGKGVYVYRVTVSDGSGQKAREYQKLVVLK
jgi:hypothetical protein